MKTAGSSDAPLLLFALAKMSSNGTGESAVLHRPDKEEMPCEECRRLEGHIESFRQSQAAFFEAEYRRHLEKAHGLKP